MLGVNTPSQPYCGSSLVSARAELRFLLCFAKDISGWGSFLTNLAGKSSSTVPLASAMTVQGFDVFLNKVRLLRTLSWGDWTV